MFKDLKAFVMASMFSQMEEAHCGKCDEFVKFVISERGYEKLRVFSVLEFIQAEYWIDIKCPDCNHTLITFRGREAPRINFAKDDE